MEGGGGVLRRRRRGGGCCCCCCCGRQRPHRPPGGRCTGAEAGEGGSLPVVAGAGGWAQGYTDRGEGGGAFTWPVSSSFVTEKGPLFW